ncbi:zinc-binding dehydrogenase [Clostridium sp. MT-14]|jgi:2-desacetyl-2-hydroxyethyl bacteriochlorophyllide A dehydrogenase|uniref:Alcohol dehydrogenase catalytic domain-containing protein n=1 Tax=Clostridium aromativorans TaxID=2836848 RepID=A0ABS8N7I9_9CLOT|nr:MULTISPECIES: alcohol dehydrogenase catalytic domain-containing protein [Clostridium]KAA8674708.1 alcohol dehydrogenase catalytic domain-containing protein [Clostridium sp. HV4-5-A1G]MCC9295651.1 alcohol dehydrogenase catalytic domain-containing protein [Clostridium aromativorans]CAB1249989.1 Galactitol-1-phosphate 5-dehydrogenase [Clostridiaceae bacterium BL-3]
MKGNMDAILKTKGAPKSVEFASVPIPQITPDQVLVRIKASGICGTDHSLYHWSEAIASSYDLSFPAIFGHEFSGVIAEVGSQVEGIKVGERVTVNPIIYCGKCSYCAEGNIEVCDNRPFLGTDYDGGFAQYVAVRAVNIIKLPDTVSFKSGALMEPLCVAIHAVDRVKPEFGDSVVVMGPGAIGLLMLLVLKNMGVGKVIVAGTSADKERLEMAKTLGADYILNTQDEGAVKKVKDLTGSKGADVIFDATGHNSAIQMAVQMITKRGRIGVTGLPPRPSELMMTQIAMNEISIIGNRAYERKNWLQACKMIDQGLNIEAIGTHTMPLKDFEKGIDLIDQKKGLRIILQP